MGKKGGNGGLIFVVFLLIIVIIASAFFIFTDKGKALITKWTSNDTPTTTTDNTQTNNQVSLCANYPKLRGEISVKNYLRSDNYSASTIIYTKVDGTYLTTGTTTAGTSTATHTTNDISCTDEILKNGLYAYAIVNSGSIGGKSQLLKFDNLIFFLFLIS